MLPFLKSTHSRETTICPKWQKKSTLLDENGHLPLDIFLCVDFRWKSLMFVFNDVSFSIFSELIWWSCGPYQKEKSKGSSFVSLFVSLTCSDRSHINLYEWKKCIELYTLYLASLKYKPVIYIAKDWVTLWLDFRFLSPIIFHMWIQIMKKNGFFGK